MRKMLTNSINTKRLGWTTPLVVAPMSDDLKEKKIEIRMSISGKLAERLTEVKKHYAYENYTELIRFLINQAYERLGLQKD